MRKLSADDAAFLDGDCANANAALIHIHNQSTAPNGTVRLESILRGQ